MPCVRNLGTANLDNHPDMYGLQDQAVSEPLNQASLLIHYSYVSNTFL
jgi:hypothetical protein